MLSRRRSSPINTKLTPRASAIAGSAGCENRPNLGYLERESKPGRLIDSFLLFHPVGGSSLLPKGLVFERSSNADQNGPTRGQHILLTLAHRHDKVSFDPTSNPYCSLMRLPPGYLRFGVKISSGGYPRVAE